MLPVTRCWANNRVSWARDKPGHLGQKTSEQTLLSLPLVDIVEPAQGLLDEPIGRSSSRHDQVDLLVALKERPNVLQGP